MRLGLVLQISDATASITDLAPEIEAQGFESLWVGEHTHMPTATVHRYTKGKYAHRPDQEEGFVPDFYRRFLSPFVTLAFAAGITSTLRLGTCISLVAEHNPLFLAKEIATLDMLSGGRVELGIGYGWNRLEMLNNGIDPDRRREIFREKVLAMKALWTEERAAFDGEHVSFSESWSWPKPVQRPHPPILVGAAASHVAFGHIIEFADSWMPLTVMSTGSLKDEISSLRRRAEEAGRDPDTVGVSLIMAPTAGFVGDERDLHEFLAGLPTPGDLEDFASLGVQRLILAPPVSDMRIAGAALDAARELLPHVDATR